MSKRLMALAIAGAMVALCGVSGASAAETKRVLTLDVAKAIADACEAYQKEQVAAGVEFRPVNVAVFDDGGNLKLFRRQENAFLGSIKISQMKAATSSNFPLPSRMWGEIAYGKDGEPGRVPGLALVPGYAAFPGGLPLMTADGQHIGGVGVSGATGDQDEECAQAGVDAVADMLK
jgi:uncharacterized protein GlcG (DUF336 family)